MSDIFGAWLGQIGDGMVYLPLLAIIFHSIFSGIFEHFLER